MKAFVKARDASITVEAAIVTSVILLLMTLMLTALINEYVRVTDYCGSLKTAAERYADSEHGEILRIVKVLVDTGGNIADGIFNGK